jgi:DNA repair exonuclease SbcCD ATPase subunit
MSAIILPRISRVRLTGFAPLFINTVEFNIPENPGSFLILGGNGLGKTTILQSIIFAIAGIADRDQQDAREDSRFKWDMSYFKDRLKDPKSAEVIVEFFLGKTNIEVRRGLNDEQVRGVRVGDDKPVNSKKAHEVYSTAVLSNSHCSSLRDFRYLVHRLCYLPESRRNIVWDPHAQLAIFLFVCAEAGVEAKIREKTALLREDFVEMRHTITSIGSIARRIEGAEKHIQQQQVGKKALKESKDEKSWKEDQKKFDAIKLKLEENTASITKITSEIVSLSRGIQLLASEIENEEIKLADSEEQFVLRSLQELERGDQALALQKLLVLHQCPYCTQVSGELANRASNYVSNGNCPICGLNHITSDGVDTLSSTKDALVQKNISRTQNQIKLNDLHNRLSILRGQNSKLEAQLSEVSVALPRIRRDERIGLTDDPADLRKMLAAYETKRRELEQKTNSLRTKIEKEYADVEQSQARHYQMIEKRVEKYATKFLGTKCTFARVSGKSVDKDISFAFDVLVPRFNDSERTEQHNCSESQAFFLDIAFRMAVLDVVRELANEPVTFICETPENALDMAYAENVAEMFSHFQSAGCFSLLTANLQSGGVAEPVLAKLKSHDERKKHIFNLLNYSHLSSVQTNAKSKFDKQLKALLKG